MSWYNRSEDEEAQPKRQSLSFRIAKWASILIVGAYVLGATFGGPCSKPELDPDSSACGPDTIVDGKTMDGPDGFWDWTKPIQAPNGIPNGLLIPAAIMGIVLGHRFYVGYKRYYARKVVTPEGAWAADLTKHLYVLPGKRFAVLRLGGVEGDPFIPADEGSIVFPLQASRMHGRSLIIYMRGVPKEQDTLPPLAAYMVEKMGVKGPHLDMVSPEDIEPVDSSEIKRIMSEMRSNLKDNTAHHQLETVARGSKVALDHAFQIGKRGFLPSSKPKTKTIVVSSNGTSKVEEDD